MKLIITGFNAISTPEGKRIGFSYSELTEAGKVATQNARGSMIVLDEDMKKKIEEIEKFIAEWIENNR